MKNRKIILISIIVSSLILSGFIIYANFKINQGIDENNTKESKLKEDVYSELGLIDPLVVEDDGKNVDHMQTIHRLNFEKLEDLTECPDFHIDVNKADMEHFLDSVIQEWQPNDWEKQDDQYYVINYTDGTSGYSRDMEYYSSSSLNSSSSMHLNITIDYDAVSDRIHNISFMLPYAENAKEAFTKIMVYLGIENVEAEKDFDKMYNGVRKLGNNEHVKHKAHGYSFYMSEYDFGNVKEDKCYYMSISVTGMLDE